MGLLLNVNNDAGVPLQYHEVTQLHWDNVLDFSTIQISSWLTQAGRSTLPPVESNMLSISGSAFLTYSEAITAGTNILTESENILRAQTPATTGHWFLTAPWSTSTQVASVYANA